MSMDSYVRRCLHCACGCSLTSFGGRDAPPDTGAGVARGASRRRDCRPFRTHQTSHLPAPHCAPRGDVLALVRLHGSLFCRAILGAPLGITAPSSKKGTVLLSQIRSSPTAGRKAFSRLAARSSARLKKALPTSSSVSAGSGITRRCIASVVGRSTSPAPRCPLPHRPGIPETTAAAILAACTRDSSTVEPAPGRSNAYGSRADCPTSGVGERSRYFSRVCLGPRGTARTKQRSPRHERERHNP